MTKKDKLLERFFALPKDFTYNELRTMLNGLGYQEYHLGKTSGSRVLFFNEKTAWNMPILTCTNIIPLSESKGYFYTWTQNKLQLARIKLKNLSQWVKRFYPVTIDQKNVFLGQKIHGERKVNGFSFFLC